jgi:hypothetical protein
MKHFYNQLIIKWANGAEVEFRFRDNESSPWSNWKICYRPTWAISCRVQYRLKDKR